MNTPVTGGFIRGRTSSTDMTMRRSSQFFALPPQPVTAPKTDFKTDFEGLSWSRASLSTSSSRSRFYPFEVVVAGESIWLGMGNDRADGLLKAIMKITEQEPEVPDN